MISLPAHLALVISGLMAVFLSELWPPLLELPWWAALPLFALVPLAQLGSDRLGRRGFWLVFLAPLAIEFGFLFLTDFGSFTVRSSPWPRIPGWPGFVELVQLLPLGVAHFMASGQPGVRFGRSIVSRGNIRVRLALFIWGTLGFYLALSGTLGQVPELRVWIEESTAASIGFSLVLFSVLPIYMSRILLAVLDTVPMGSYWSELAAGLSASMGVRSPRLFEWRTNGEIANAVVLTAPLGPRPVLFTDAFLQRLSMEEFRSVLAHELGHIAGHHIRIFLAFILGIVLVLEGFAGGQLDGELGVPLALIALVGLGLGVGFISRRLELEADLFALEATGEVEGLARALGAAGGYQSSRRSWRHFSTTRRLIFLRAALHDRGVGQRLRKSIRLIYRFSFGMALIGALAVGWHGIQEWPAERFWIDLRLGKMQAASQRLADDRSDNENFVAQFGHSRIELEQLVALGVQLEADGESLETRRLGELAAGAFDRGQLRLAKQFVDLATLIADPNMAAVVAMVSGDDRWSGQLTAWKPLAEWLKQPF